jgi:hypothetical protein
LAEEINEGNIFMIHLMYETKKMNTFTQRIMWEKVLLTYTAFRDEQIATIAITDIILNPAPSASAVSVSKTNPTAF